MVPRIARRMEKTATKVAEKVFDRKVEQSHHINQNFANFSPMVDFANPAIIGYELTIISDGETEGERIKQEILLKGLKLWVTVREGLSQPGVAFCRVTLFKWNLDRDPVATDVYITGGSISPNLKMINPDFKKYRYGDIISDRLFPIQPGVNDPHSSKHYRVDRKRNHKVIYGGVGGSSGKRNRYFLWFSQDQNVPAVNSPHFQWVSELTYQDA